MAQLVYRSLSDRPDEVKVTFYATAQESLVPALRWFAQQATDLAQLLLNMPNVPEVIRVRAANTIASHQAGVLAHEFTVKLNSNGSFSIWNSEGPDRYDLID